MENVSLVGIDLAKRSFHLHGAAADGSVVFRKKLSRPQLTAFLSELPKCVVAMEACATSHDWAREIGKLGHEARLIPPVYVKPFMKRQKNDANDAEAIAEAASRPTMRYVSVKSAEQQSQGMVFRTRDLVVRQRSQLVNALRGHLAEYGVVVAQGMVQFRRMITSFYDVAADLPAQILSLCQDTSIRSLFLTKGLWCWITRSKAEQKQMKQHHGLCRSPELGPCALRRFRPSRHQWRNFTGVSLQLGAGLYQSRSRPVGDKSWAEPQKWDSAI